MEFLQDPAVWVAIATVIFVALAAKKVSTAVAKGLDERSARIRAELAETERLRDEAAALLAEYQKKQRDALKDAEAIVATAREEAARYRTEAAASLEASLKRRERAATESIAQAEAHAVKALRNQAIEIAIAAARQALAQNLDPARSGALIDQALGDLEKRLH
jgi:F-type H+-transporting ATPase subunit b